jgi:hypothetical protein
MTLWGQFWAMATTRWEAVLLLALEGLGLSPDAACTRAPLGVMAKPRGAAAGVFGSGLNRGALKTLLGRVATVPLTVSTTRTLPEDWRSS